MAKNVFSVPIFFIAFRECLEAALIISILLGLVEQIVTKGAELLHHHFSHQTETSDDQDKKSTEDSEISDPVEREAAQKLLIKKLRIQIFAGSLAGLLLALAIGAAFIAVWFTQAKDFWAKSEELWEGIFYLIAAVIIFLMGITMLKLDQAKAKWRVKLQLAFEKKAVDTESKASRWVLFLLPFITVLREGLEAVVFIGGVSLGQPATSIPLAAIVGLLCGAIVGFILYQFASRSSLRFFLIVMTNLLLLVGAGLFSRAVGAFERYKFNKLCVPSSFPILGPDISPRADWVLMPTTPVGDGPGSFPVNGNVWHLDCCNPENKSTGWGIFAAIFGWSNNGSLGTVLSYIFYWLAVIAVLIYLKFTEGRTKILGKESKAGTTRREKREAAASATDA